MAKECESQLGLVADAAEPLVDDVGGLSDGVGAEVGELGSLQVAPYLFDRVEVVGVRRKSLDHQPVTLALDECLHGSAAVRRQSVPDEGDLVAVEMALELDEELHERFVVVGTGLHAREASLPSGRKHTAADIDRRFQLKWWVRTGVLPFGAQVALTEGRRLNPLSSWKQIQALLAWAFSLPWANAR